MAYVALDLETTGLDPERDVIIEIGAVKFDQWRELNTFSTLVNPSRSIPLQITQLTGITDDDVFKAPLFSSIKADLIDFVGNDTIIGHNVSFDLSFLRQQRCLTRNAHIDTFALATILMPHESRYSLGKLMDSLGIVFESRHRALDDARASMKLFLELKARAVDLPAQTLGEINRAARGSRWALGGIFQDAEREQQRQGVGSSIGAQLRAKGLLDASRPAFARTEIGEPLIPVDRRTVLDIDLLAAMLEEGGRFSETFAGFEYRAQQVDMLRQVACAFNQSRHLLVEAGTGTGKSIAYLLPAMYWAVQNGERVVISTNTINLQDQLSSKDIPDLQKLLPFEVRATVLKGRTNYLCLRRLALLQNQPGLDDDHLRVLSRILVWLPNTLTGDQTELFLPQESDWAVWAQVSADARTCTGSRCPHFRKGECFFYRARRAAENAHLIVVNHALLLSDVAADNRVLPLYNYLIIDEAHHLEDATTSQLGREIGRREISVLLNQIAVGSERQPGWADRALSACDGRLPDQAMNDLNATLHAVIEDMRGCLDLLAHLFDDLAAFLVEYGDQKGPYDHRLRLTHSLRIQSDWMQVEMAWDLLSGDLRSDLEGLGRAVQILQDHDWAEIPGYDDLLGDGLGLLQQLGTVYAQMESVLLEPGADEITWLRAQAKTSEISLCVAPLRVGHLVERHLMWPKEAVVFTSATLCTDNDFNFIKDRLGAYDAEELAVGSPFDYPSQVLLYLPTDIPEPNEPYYQKTINECLVVLAQATQGRMLVLFTSYSQLKNTSEAIGRPLAERGITVYAQGSGASRSQLLENLRTVPRSVLLGTRSFWEGVDVPGEALSCVVMVKLPFAVPSDPVFAARSEDMDDPFMQYAVPDAILRFRQGFGRLIRTKTDRGVVAVLDKRVHSKRYGEMFIHSLPPCTTIKGGLAALAQQAARWIDEGPFEVEGDAASTRPRAGRKTVDNELEYVSLDDDF
ncbi:MAG: 3'-5' exoribonuclease [Anaerolineae bacterium]|nr:3'-5' exoribonuclease [Anaerolineae bacterium]